MPNMIPVSSSNIAAVGYDGASQTLYVQFRHGGTYAYSSVPNSVYIGLRKQIQEIWANLLALLMKKKILLITQGMAQ